MGVTIKESGSGFNFEDALRFLQNQVLVGIPEEKTERKQGKITNAQLLFVHAHGVRMKPRPRRNESGKEMTPAQSLYALSKGSPALRIPARPVIEPALEEYKADLADMLRNVAVTAIEGDLDGAMALMDATGQLAQRFAQDYFHSGKLTPLSEKTIARRKNGSDVPLIDTGDMSDAIVYVIRDKEGNDI